LLHAFGDLFQNAGAPRDGSLAPFAAGGVRRIERAVNIGGIRPGDLA
jgi:hypothetical protein